MTLFSFPMLSPSKLLLKDIQSSIIGLNINVEIIDAK